MPLYTFKCKCGKTQESVRSIDNRDLPELCECGKKADRIFDPAGMWAPNEDAPHIRSSIEAILSPKDRSPEAMEARRAGTRTALHNLMKAKGLRRMDPAEKAEPEPWNPSKDEVFKRQMYKADAERRRIEVRD